MIDRPTAARYIVRLSVPRIVGWRGWGAVSGEFERRLVEQASRAVTSARLESESRRGRDYVRVTVLVTVEAADVAQAMAATWRVFRKAAGDDIAGWDLPGAAAEIRPVEPLTHQVPRGGMRTASQAAAIAYRVQTAATAGQRDRRRRECTIFSTGCRSRKRRLAWSRRALSGRDRPRLRLNLGRGTVTTARSAK
jgi:hypothetical protein